MTAPTRPVLRYHGGKWRLAPWIISHFPEHRVYIEPYGGAGSVMMRKEPARAEVYNDLDEEVVNLFTVLRDRTAAARRGEQLRLTPYSRLEFFRSYQPTEDSVERARRRIVRAAMAFGTSSGKRNRTGFRATPWRTNGATGVQDFVTYPDALELFTARLRCVSIECRPALEIIAQQDELAALFYIDPPYPHATRSAIRCPSDRERAYLHDMTDDDHRRMAEQLHQARGMVVVSGYASDLYDVELFPAWQRETRRTNADGGRGRTEVLWLNPACSEGLRAQREQMQLGEASA